ncbi:MAG TPA: hypothetical protein VLS87_02745 [Woeseiaceae bacterium]|nr:hypothetical protein [Woeseiaceae bacterium]
MDNRRSDGSVTGEPGTLAAAGESAARNPTSPAGADLSRDGDIIRGLRSGLIFSLAIWAVLLTVGTVIFR